MDILDAIADARARLDEIERAVLRDPPATGETAPTPRRSERGGPRILWGSFAITQGGTSCPIGDGPALRVFDALLAHLNDYRSHAQIMATAWRGRVSAETVRGAVHDLRKALTAGGLSVLAHAIESDGRGHYRLVPVWRKKNGSPTEVQRISNGRRGRLRS